MLIPISEITVNAGRREVLPENVHKLADSILEVGLLNPIIVDHTQVLIAGLHRLEAVKLLGWTEIECTKHFKCPPEKRAAIEAALRHFGMID